MSDTSEFKDSMRQNLEMSLNSVLARRSEIISDIFVNGLNSPKVLQKENRPYVGSADTLRLTNETIWGTIINPEKKDNISKLLDHRLYSSYESILPVIIERKPQKPRTSDFTTIRNAEVRDYTANELSVLEKRAKASFLVIAKANNPRLKPSAHFFESGVGQVKDSLPANEIYLFIFPEEVWRDYLLTKSQSASISKDRIIVVKNSVEKFVGGKAKVLLNVPDYEQALLDLMSNLSHPIWVHGVRLPIEEDFKE